MSYNTSRRAFLGFGLSGAALFGLTACGSSGGSGPSPEDTPEFGATMRMSLFGTAERQARVRSVFDLYSAKFGGSIDPQIVANASYAEQLATQMAGGAAADVVSLFQNIVAEYARRDQLVDLSQWDSVLDVSKFDETALESGVIADKRVALPLGDNAFAAFYDDARLQALGKKAPEPGHTWDEFVAFANDVTTASGGQYFGTIDASGEINLFEIWLRQRGLALYTDEAALGFTSSDLQDWFGLWDELRRAGAAPPAGQTAESTTGGFGTALMVTGRASNFFIYGNVFKAFQGLTPSTLALTTPPVGDEPGLFVRASNWMGAYARGENTDDAVNLMNFMLNDPEGVKALGSEFGAPPNTELRSQLTYEPADQAFIDYVSLVADEYAQPVPALDVEFPEGAPQVQTALLTISQAIAAGDSSVQDGSDQLVQQAEGFLR